MVSIKQATGEYVRVMSCIDVNDETKRRIIEKCSTPSRAFKLQPKPAIAAISCTAVLVAVGTQIYKFARRAE